MKECRRFLTQSPFFRNCWGCAADNLWTLDMTVWHKLWLCCTVQSSFKPVLGATAVFEIARGSLHSGKLGILYNIELRVCPDQKTALQECLMPSLIPAMQEMSTIALLRGCWCLLLVWSGLQICLLKSPDLGGFPAQSRIHYHLVKSLIWYIVYLASVARCAFGDQLKTEGMTQGVHAQVAGLRWYIAGRNKLCQPWPP